MSRKLLHSVSLLGLTVACLTWAAPQPVAQTFVGTPVPPQFARVGQPSTRNGEWPTNGADVQFTRYRADGSVIGVYPAVYVIVQTDEGWRIQARSSYAP